MKAHERLRSKRLCSETIPSTDAKPSQWWALRQDNFSYKKRRRKNALGRNNHVENYSTYIVSTSRNQMRLDQINPGSVVNRINYMRELIISVLANCRANGREKKFRCHLYTIFGQPILYEIMTSNLCIRLGTRYVWHQLCVWSIVLVLISTVSISNYDTHVLLFPPDVSGPDT